LLRVSYGEIVWGNRPQAKGAQCRWNRWRQKGNALTRREAYDLAGNRTTSFLSTTHNHDDLNRLLEDDAFTYTYDNNGNLTIKTSKATSAVTTYQWDAQDQLIQIDRPDSTTVTYKYDGLGRRIEKNVAGTITRYVYDGEDILLKYDGTNIFRARYSHGDQVDQPLILQKAGLGFFYYHSNHQGSITHLTNSSGTIANSYVYDSYGRRLNVFESVVQPFSYTGREFDQESGLYFYRARYFDAQTGRFLSEDPIRFTAGDQNLYRYVFNDPVNFVDPLGLEGTQCPPDPPRPPTREEMEEACAFFPQFCKTDPPPLNPDPKAKQERTNKASEQSKSGNLKKLSDSQAKKVAQEQGFKNAEDFKKSETGPDSVRKFNMNVDKGTGEIVLTPVTKGGGPNIPTGKFTK